MGSMNELLGLRGGNVCGEVRRGGWMSGGGEARPLWAAMTEGKTYSGGSESGHDRTIARGARRFPGSGSPAPYFCHIVLCRSHIWFLAANMYSVVK